MSGFPGALPLGRGIILDDASTARVRAFSAVVGIRKAAQRLRVGEDTIYAARGRSRIQATTAARLLEALEREEAVLASGTS